MWQQPYKEKRRHGGGTIFLWSPLYSVRVGSKDYQPDMIIVIFLSRSFYSA